ncbi:hypothetical protein [Desulfovibrio oxyclinae]|jgi:uncharacterized protein YidB (DUF937 family)|uniref:hypothetical protein n=1 Tax=Desulfovibrio oxyclinae TaxID=63560 RepID=UPI00038255D3|nr:hypothetical protein [Desulfovibrio oxyclinae]
MNEELRSELMQLAKERGIDEQELLAVLAGLPEVPASLNEILEAVLGYLGDCERNMRERQR